MGHHHRSLLPALAIAMLPLLAVACSETPTPRAPASAALLSPPRDAASIQAHNAAIAAMGRFDYDTAFDLLTPLAGANRGWLDGQVDLAIAQLNRQHDGDEAAALARLDAVLARDPSHLRAHHTAGILRSVLETPEAALGHFEVVAKADETDAYAAYFTGQALAQQGQWAQAVLWFARAIKADAYLRSSYYAGSQAARRAGDTAQAQAWLATFQRMEHNPRATLAEVKYTRMGPRAQVRAIDAVSSSLALPPKGDVFDYHRMGFKACDQCPPYQDVSVAWLGEGRNLVLCSTEQYCELMTLGPSSHLEHVVDPSQPLEVAPIAGVTMVRSALWGDIDADGHVDVVLCRNGRNELWMGADDLGFQKDDRFIGGSATAPDGMRVQGS